MFNKDKDADSAFSALGERYVYYGQGMKKNWIEANTIFLKHVVSKFGQNTKASLLAGKLITTELDSSKLPKFKNKE